MRTDTAKELKKGVDSVLYVCHKRSFKPLESEMFKLVEKKNHNAVHGIFDTHASAQRHLAQVIPEYVAKSYFMDKSLRADDFEIITKGLDRP